jgi:hypothetical protein
VVCWFIANVLALPQSAFAIDTYRHLSRSPYCVPAAIRPVNDSVLPKYDKRRSMRNNLWGNEYR